MKPVKNILLCIAAVFGYGAIWVLLLYSIRFLSEITWLTFAAVHIGYIGIVLAFTLKYLKQKDKSVFKRIGYVVLVAVPSYAVLNGVFHLMLLMAAYR